MIKSFTCVLLAITVAAIANAQTIYVTPSGAGLFDGSSWSNAFSGSSLRSVLALAPYGAQVWVSAGTYLPAVTGRDTSFDVNDGVRVYGGFTGTETLLSERDYSAHATILSGDVGVPGDMTDNSYHVVHFTNTDATTTLDGFTVENGMAYDSTTQWGTFGAGILNTPFGSTYTQSSPVVRNCIIRNNRAKDKGGGMADVSYGGFNNAYIVKCSFLNNNAHNSDTSYTTVGGGLAFISESLVGSRIQNITSTVDSCLFDGNYAQFGGGIFVTAIDAYCSPTIRNCLIQNNTAILGGGIASLQQFFYYGGYANVHVVNTHLTKNHSKGYYGGGIYSSDYMGWGGDLVIDSCLVDSNTSGISVLNNYGTNTYTQILNSHIVNNGDSILWGTNALQFENLRSSIDTFLIANCVLYNRIPGWNGGSPVVLIKAGDLSDVRVTFENTTLYKDFLPDNGFTPVHISNQIETGLGSGGPSTISLNLLNSILWCNISDYTAVENTAGGISVYSKNSLIKHFGGSGAWTGVGTDGGGNLDSYPYFRDTAHADLRLGCGSPAFNHGDNTLLPSSITTDIDGTARIKYGTVDIGAYEADSSIFTGPLVMPVATVRHDTGTYISAPTGSLVDSVRWDFGDGTGSTLDTAIHHYSGPGTYTVCLHVFNGCGTTDSCFPVTIVCSTVPVAAFTHTGAITFSFTYIGTATAIDSVVWSYGDGHRDTGIHSVHTYTTLGTFTVCATVYTPCGSDSVCSTVVVSEAGIANLTLLSSVIIYPNPASDQLIIEHAVPGTIVRMVNVVGQQVYSATIPGTRHMIDTRQLPGGTYILQLTDMSGDRVTQSVVKE